MSPRHALVLMLVISLATLTSGQAPTITIKAPRTSPASGRQMYVAYCASCHGNEGRGAGPVAVALKSTPPNLTTLAKRNNGKFPADHVYQVIRGDANVPAYGDKEMPAWGPVFLSRSDAHPAEVQLRITNLTKYIESLQEK